MNPSDFSKSIIALACWRATQGETHQAMLCVCMVFLNRADTGWYGGDLYDNCTAWLSENDGDFPDTREPQFQQLLAKLDGVISGQVPDKTGGALYFVKKQDAVEKLAGSITATIGNMIFLR
jgi:hypothetical protein